MDATTATALGTPVLMQVLDYGGLGIAFLSVAAWGYFERRRADRLAVKNDALVDKITAMLEAQTPLMAGLIKQGDRIEQGHQTMIAALQSVKEAYAILRAEIVRGGQQ